MATEVLKSFDDFVLFPQQRDNLYSDTHNLLSADNLDRLYEDMASNYPQDFSSLSSYYDPYHQEPGMTTGDIRFYDPSRAQADRSLKTTNSTSPAVSVSQSLDHAPSNFSHASAASGQSTASSAVGSPYSSHQSLPAGQDNWVDMGGLGIGGGLNPSDIFPPDTYHLAPTEAGGNYSDKYSSSYVGESLPISQTATSVSPTTSASASAISCSPLSEASSFVSLLSTTSSEFGIIPTFKNPFDSSTASNSHVATTTYIPDPGRSISHPTSLSTFSSSYQRRDSQLQTRFFDQSSGNFVAPLNSTCWFSLPSLHCS